MGSAFSRTAAHTQAATDCHSAEDIKATEPGTQTHPGADAQLDQQGPGGSDGQDCQHGSITAPAPRLSEVPDTPANEASRDGRERGPLATNTPVTTYTRRKRKGAVSTPITSSKQQKRRKCNGWTYVGLQYGTSPDIEDHKRPGWIQCPDGRWYPKESTVKEGDVPVSVYTNEEYDKEEEYVVEAILDERRRGTIVQYRMKWKGYELDPKEFVKREALEDCEALDLWEAAQTAAKSTSRELDLHGHH